MKQQLHLKHIWDINSGFFGVPINELMEEAGKQVALYCAEMEGPFLIIVGPGNNGGDGLVCARYLHEMGKEVQVLLTKPPESIKSVLRKENFGLLCEKLPSEKVLHTLPETLENYVIIDALFGIGFRGEWRKPYSTIRQILQKHSDQIISIDVPSGFPDDPILIKTVCALEYADDELKEYCSKKGIELRILPIGIPEKAKTGVGPAQMMMYWPDRKQAGHKGDHGHLTIIGGSKDYFGAPIIAGEGAVRSGVDLIEVFFSPRYLQLAEKVLPELILHTYVEDNISMNDMKNLKAAIDRSTAVLIGPGLKGDPEMLPNIIHELLIHCAENAIPVVVDAGGLMDMSSYPGDTMTNWTFTPHQGEWERMTGSEDSQAVKEIAQNYNVTILLKGPEDTIVSPSGEIMYNFTGNAALTKGGTGDLLSGLVAGLQAQGVSGFHAAQLSSFILGLAGDEIAQVASSSFTIDELSVTLSHVISNYVR